MKYQMITPPIMVVAVKKICLPVVTIDARDEPRIVRVKPVLLAHPAHEIDIVVDTDSHPNRRNRKGVYI